MVASPCWLPPEEKMRTGTGDSLSRDRQNLVITLMLLVKQWNCFLERTLKVSDLFPSHPSAMHSIASHCYPVREWECCEICLQSVRGVQNLAAALVEWETRRQGGIMQHQPHRCHLMCCVIPSDIEKLLDWSKEYHPSALLVRSRRSLRKACSANRKRYMCRCQVAQARCSKKINCALD